MSICYYYDNEYTYLQLKTKIHFRLIESVNIDCNIKITQNNNIMEKILSKYCNGTIVGYNKKDSCYLFKRMSKSICKLFILISVNEYDLNKCYLTIIPKIGKDNDIKNFINRFIQIIELYNNSPFLRDELENK
jgi:hypothetical protein